MNAESLSATTKSGQRFSVDFKSGQATVAAGQEKIVDEAKVAYTVTCAKTYADRFKWNFKMTGKNSFVISRRY